MIHSLKSLYNDDNGFIVSGELVLISTIAVLALVVGLTEVSGTSTTNSKTSARPSAA